MSKTVYKYPLSIAGDITQLVLTGRVVHFADQHGRLTLWAESDDTQVAVARKFQIVGTGQAVPEAGEFIASTITRSGFFVFHLYEVI